MYCNISNLSLLVFGTVLAYGRGHDDELNTLAAGTCTGLMFKSTGKTRSCPLNFKSTACCLHSISQFTHGIRTKIQCFYILNFSAGLRGCAKGGAAGFGITAAYVLATRKDKVMQMLGQ